MTKDNLLFAAEQLEKYLNIAQEFTEDYQITRRLGDEPIKIIKESGEKLKRIAAAIYVCKEILRFTSHEITYSANGFRVEIHYPEVPF